MTEKIIRYLQAYIRLLVKGQEEYFIAIADIEKNTAEEFIRQKTDYEKAWFDRREYSQAVVLRNRTDVSKIVLFSDDSVKMIDSLKDFVEYPSIPDDKNIFWQCMAAAFGQEMDADCKKLLNTVMELRQTVLEDLFRYMDCGMENGTFVFEKLVKNLYQLELWVFADRDIDRAKNKPALKRLIRNSDALLVEEKLMKGIAEKKVSFSAARRRHILKWLSQNDFKSVFQNVRYDEKIEALFQGSGRRRRNPVQEKQEEQSYENSYEYAMQEMPEESMQKVEAALLKPENEILKDSMQKFSYPDEAEIEAEFREIREEMELLSLTEEKKAFLRLRLEELQKLFGKAAKEGSAYTPSCLWHYAQSQKAFVRSYFALMGRCVADTGIARMCLGVHFLSRLQGIFCTEKDGVISMPFYHPLAGLYLISLQKKYEEYKSLSALKTGEFWEQAVRAMIEKESMHFPVRYMLHGEELYQLDDGSLKERGQRILFEKAKEHTAGSLVNIRLLNEDLLDYLERQKYLSEIQVTIIDIRDVSGIMSMAKRLKRFAELQQSMVHRVILNIISSQEEKLKKELQENMDMALENPQILFRFTKERYTDGEEYQMQRIIRDSDLLFLADSSITYQKPRLREYNRQPNRLLLRFEQFDAVQLTEEEQGSMLEVLWDSVHFMELNDDAKLAYWETRELNQSLLNLIRREVKEDPHRTVVLVSSNPQLMQHFYHLPEFQVRHSILSGQEMLLVSFHEGSRRKLLREDGEASVTVPLKPFLEGVTGTDDMGCVLCDRGESPETPYFTVSFQEKEFCFACRVFIQDREEADESRRKHYEGLMADLQLLLNQSRTFQKKFVLMLYEEADNIPTALMLDFLQRTQIRDIRCQYEEIQEKPKRRNPADAASVIQFQRMLAFIRGRNGIDEYAVCTFAELYQKEMPGQCMRADKQLNLLDERTRKKMQALCAKLEEKNG